MEESSNMSFDKLVLILKGIGISLLISLIMILVLSIVLSMTDIKESIIMPSVIFISSFSILVGAFLVSKRIDEKGIIFGSLLGLLYMLILYVISSIINFNFSLNLNAAIMIGFGVFGGAIRWNFGCKFKIIFKKQLIFFEN